MRVREIVFILVFVFTLGLYFFWPFVLAASFFEKVVSLAYFIALLYMTGYSVSRGIVFTKDRLELYFMRTGFGLAALPFLLVLLDTFGVPLHWMVLLLLSVVFPLWGLKGVKKKRGKRGFKLPSVDWHTGLAVLTASLVFAVALIGSFTYPYLEDGDSWEHAVGTKYISLKYTYTKPEGVYVSHYLPPYPPTYDAIMAVIHQLNNHLQWTLKAFNAFMIGLTMVYAFYFIREYTSSRDIALYSIIFLSAVPAFGSHTIWSHTLGIGVLYPLFYSINKLKSNPWFTNLSIFLLASSMVTQPLVSMVIGVFYMLYLISHTRYGKKEFNLLFKVGALGLALSMVYWIPSVVKYGIELENVDRVGGELLDLNLRFGFGMKDKPPDVRRLVFPLTHGDIYMQPGFGLFYSILVLSAVTYITVMYSKSKHYFHKKEWLLTALLWLSFTFIGLMSIAFPVSIYPARFWGFVPIGGSILVAFITVEILKHIEVLGGNPKTAALIIISLVLLTSGYYKLRVQVKAWPSDIGTHLDKQIQGYVNLVNMESDTMVYPLCLDDKFVIGMDKLSLPWEPDVVGFRHMVLVKTPRELNNFLKLKGYEYTIIESYCVEKCVKDVLGSSNDRIPKAVRDRCVQDLAVFLRGMMDYDGFERVYADNKTGMFKVK
jgi:hypothetical protein